MESPHRLYLSKGKELVYIDNCKIPQHHIDGIRFLYRVFKKNKPGAILNDPVGVNKEVQIVLFLKAVCHLLDKTILVLCPEGTERDWLQLFQTWTDLGDDVVIETAKPYLKKKVIINSMVNLPSFSQLAWSVVVVTDDSPPSAVLRYTFKADFKIWNTSVNIKKNLSIFPSIYTWLSQDKGTSKNPMEKFNISEFTPDRNSIGDVIDKAVLLDAFMEDIVIRRKKIDCNLEAGQNLPTPKVTKKNKDATGTKIKRSKRKIQDSALTHIKGIESIDPKIPKPSDVGKEDITKPSTVLAAVTSDNLQEQIKEFNKNSVCSQDSDMRLIYETDSMTENDIIYEMNTLVDDAHIEDNNKGIVNSNEMDYDDDCIQEESKINDLNEILKTDNANVIQDDHIESDVIMDARRVIQTSDATNNTQEFVTEITENQSTIECKKLKDTMESQNDITVANNEMKYAQTTPNVSVGNDNDIKESNVVKDVSVQEELDEIDLKNNQFKEQALKRFKGSILDSIF